MSRAVLGYWIVFLFPGERGKDNKVGPTFLFPEDISPMDGSD
jgi:hypothetical protein